MIIKERPRPTGSKSENSLKLKVIVDVQCCVSSQLYSKVIELFLSFQILSDRYIQNIVQVPVDICRSRWLSI